MSRMKSRTRYLSAALVTVVAVALVAFALTDKVTEKEVAASLLAMLGTFLGALFAFKLNENKEQVKV